MLKRSLNFTFSLLAGTLFFAITTSAQSYYIEDPKKFYGGPVIGVNLDQVDGDQFAGYNKVGLNVGGIMYITLANRAALSLEILYSQKGSRAAAAQPVAPGVIITDYGITLNYAEVPVMINIFDKHKSHASLGVSYARLGTSKESITTNPPITYDPNAYPFKKTDFDLLIGGSIHIWKGLFVNARFQYSLMSIRDKIPQSYAKAEQYNNVWAIRLMYLFM